MGQIQNKTYTAPDGTVYRVEDDGSITKIKGGMIQSNEPPSKYQITPEGKIYRVESDGSVTYLGNAEEKIDGNSKNNENIRIPEKYSALVEYEEAILRGEELKANIRREVAKETCNEKVLWICIRDSASTVVAAAKDNPILTPEMKSVISKKEMAQKKTKQDKEAGNDDSENKGCLWLIIIASALGAIFSYLKGESWFSF